MPQLVRKGESLGLQDCFRSVALCGARHQRYGVGDPHDEIYIAHMYIKDGVGKGWDWDLAIPSVVGSGVG